MTQLAYFPGGYYHLYNRGRSRLSICHDPQDYLDILDKLKTYSRKYHIMPIAYSLLPNHYHILGRQMICLVPACLPSVSSTATAKSIT